MSKDTTVLHPHLRIAIPKILATMSAAGFPMTITSTERTEEEQLGLYAQGRSKSGAVVTDCDGVVRKSLHQKQVDTFVHACDLAFLVDNKPSWALDLPWKLYGVLAQTYGLTWGGTNSLHDMPHIEVPNAPTSNTIKA